jgi:hypothetical protein
LVAVFWLESPLTTALTEELAGPTGLTKSTRPPSYES